MTDGPALYVYGPLWGASFDSDEAGEIAPGVAVYIPSAEEWRTVQQKDVWLAQWRAEGGRGNGPKPPPCVVVRLLLEHGQTIHDAVAEHRDLLSTAMRDAVTTLRVSRAGWFLHPEQSMWTYYAPTLNPNVVRAPGPYRQTFVTGGNNTLLAPFALRIGELTRDAATSGTIAACWDRLQAYRVTGGDASVEIAIESFNRSYGYQLLPRSRAGNLFTALDAMLGGMSAWKIGRVPVKPRGYARRVEVALRTSGAPEPVADSRALGRWLASGEGGRGLRNAIAHGELDGGEAPARDAYERLQSIVRCVLHQYLHFAAAWLGQHEETIGRLRLDEDAPLAAAYVTALEAEAREPGSMTDLLQPV